MPKKHASCTARAAFHVEFVVLVPRSAPVSCRSCRFPRRFRAGFVPLVLGVRACSSMHLPRHRGRAGRLRSKRPSQGVRAEERAAKEAQAHNLDIFAAVTVVSAT